MSLYAESSAVFAWLLDEQAGAFARQTLSESPTVVASDLTLIECDRALHRAAALGEADGGRSGRSTRLIGRCRRALARSPNRSRGGRARPATVPWRSDSELNAIHIASVLVARSAVAGLELLSLDDRIRGVAKKGGLKVLP